MNKKVSFRRIIASTILSVAYLQSFCQEFKVQNESNKHSDKITAIATCNGYFATSSKDNSFILWDYNGKKIFRKAISNGHVTSMAFVPNSKLLLVASVELKSKRSKYIITCYSYEGNKVIECRDTTLTQDYVNTVFNRNTAGVQNAIAHAKKIVESINDIEAPRISDGLSHLEVIQSIDVSPNQRTIASIDKYNVLKIWSESGRIKRSFLISNDSFRTKVYFLSDSTLLVTPNIILNINSENSSLIEGYEKYTSLPSSSKIYFFFDYNDSSKSEKILDLVTSNVASINEEIPFSLKASSSKDKFALLGVDGLVRMLSLEGKILATFGKEKSEMITFRGEKYLKHSKICEIGISPDGKHLVSGDELGKVTIWKAE